MKKPFAVAEWFVPPIVVPAAALIAVARAVPTSRGRKNVPLVSGTSPILLKL